MNELEKRAKFHKKKRKGLSPFCKLDAGNVELNNAIFNASTPTEGPSNNPISGPFGGDVGEASSASGGGDACGASCSGGMGECLETDSLNTLNEGLEDIIDADLIEDINDTLMLMKSLIKKGDFTKLEEQFYELMNFVKDIPENIEDETANELISDLMNLLPNIKNAIKCKDINLIERNVKEAITILMEFLPEALLNDSDKDLLIEGIDRASMIADLKRLGKSYFNFNKYPDHVLYRIWEKETQKAEANKMATEISKTEDSEEWNEPEFCEICGRQLTDVTKECPWCDLGDRSVLEEDYNGQAEIELEYEEIPVEIEYGSRSWEDGSYDKCFKGNVSVTYTITNDEAIEVLQDKIYDCEECKDMTEEQFAKYLEDNIEELVEKHIEILKDYYFDYAVDKAYRETDPYQIEADREADYWDSVYDDGFMDDTNPYNLNETFEEDDDFDMFMRGV